MRKEDHGLHECIKLGVQSQGHRTGMILVDRKLLVAKAKLKGKTRGSPNFIDVFDVNHCVVMSRRFALVSKYSVGWRVSLDVMISSRIARIGAMKIVHSLLPSPLFAFNSSFAFDGEFWTMSGKPQSSVRASVSLVASIVRLSDDTAIFSPPLNGSCHCTASLYLSVNN